MSRMDQKRKILGDGDVMSAPATQSRLDDKIESPKQTAEPLQSSLQTPCGSNSKQFAQNQTQVARRYLDQVSFSHFDKAAQPGSARASRFTDVGKGSFRAFTPKLLQSLASTATYAPAIGIHRFLLPRRFVRPAIGVLP